MIPEERIETINHPIILSADDVRAVLNGNKTQMRRVIEPQPVWCEEIENYLDTVYKRLAGWELQDEFFNAGATDGQIQLHFRDKLPHKPGDVLWVRETWEPLEFNDHEIGICYAATATGLRSKNLVDWVSVGEEESLKWQHRSGEQQPATTMPKWASRITLEVTDVRFELLQKITEEDAVAEGCESSPQPFGCVQCDAGVCSAHQPPVGQFMNRWNSRNRDHQWASNPWVRVETFKQLEHGE